MSSNSNRNGRAFEYACITSWSQSFAERTPTCIVKDKLYNNRKDNWLAIPNKDREDFIRAASSVTPTLIQMEPMIEETGTEPLTMCFIPDPTAEGGDLRDILLSRKDKNWTIGMSVKHNHNAVKHSRLASELDFCNKWFGIPCTSDYWNDIKPIFNRLKQCRDNNIEWKSINDKEISVYIPVLSAFIKEIKNQYASHGSVVPRKMVEYLLGTKDYYKIIAVDKESITTVQMFNFHGTLGKESSKRKPPFSIPLSYYPERIIDIKMKPKSKNSVEMFLDNGWTLEFRIHNASNIVEPSLKFDIKLTGQPPSIICTRSSW